MLGEFEAIKSLLLDTGRTRADGYPASSDDSGVVLGAGDDAALLACTPGCRQVVSVDTSVADIHFPASAPAEAIGHRALAVSISDLAAMGAHPRWCLLALTLPDINASWVADFARGFHALARSLGVQLVGGDLTRGQLAASVTVHGEVPAGMALRRDGAVEGDLIAVTGSLGNACGGLQRWQSGECAISTDPLLDAYLYPQPRIQAGLVLRTLAHSAMDVSDGLVADLNHLCRASGVGAALDIDSLPVSQALEHYLGKEKALEAALGGGDDYELLVTLPAQSFAMAQQRLVESGTRLTAIGQMTGEPGIQGIPEALASSAGWQHFTSQVADQ